MQRFYLPGIDYKCDEIDLKNQDFPEIYNQITRVLRYHPGDEIYCFSGDGNDYCYEISSITQDRVSLKRCAQKDIFRTNSSHALQLFQALPNKIEKMEWILQKGTEIGITDFHFFPSERSQVSSIVSGEKKNKYAHLGREKTGAHHKNSFEEAKILQRFEKILIEATEQSHGPRIPEIHLSDTIPNIDGVCFFAHTSGETPGIIPLCELPEKSEYFVGDISLLIGPEGGWSEKEVMKFIDTGAIPVSFGERILRTETASISLAFFLRQFQDGNTQCV